MRECSVLRVTIGGVLCRRILRRVIFAVVLMLAAGTSLSTSAAALATPLGPWLPNPPIDLSATGQDAESPQVATGPDGATTIIWRRNTGSSYIVQAATRAANATTFSTPIDLSTIGANASSPQVATGPDGTTTITWTRDNNSSEPESSEGIVQAVTATPPPSVLTITKTGNGTVTSTPANINCGTTCTATITNLTTITLTATPAADSTFSGWSGDCTGTSTCTVEMTDARNVTATFTLTPIALSATNSPPTTPTAIRWTPRTGTTNEPITGSFTAAATTTYSITATSSTTQRLQTRATRTARGTCKITTNKKTKKRTAKCTIRFKHAGTWLVKITPTKTGLAGTPATKTIKIRAATKKTRTLPTHQRLTLAQR